MENNTTYKAYAPQMLLGKYRTSLATAREAYDAIRQEARRVCPERSDRNCYVIAMCVVTGEDYATVDEVVSTVCRRGKNKGTTYDVDAKVADAKFKELLGQIRDSRIDGRITARDRRWAIDEAIEAGTFHTMNEVLGYFGLKATRVNHRNIGALTPTTLERTGLPGTWVATTKGHIFGMLKGKVVDWTAGRKHRIKGLYRIEQA